jgi:predicted outer membrane repeat protein
MNTGSVFGAVLYVDVNNPGAGTGANDPYGSIRDAVGAAVGNDTILIANGTYSNATEQFSTLGEINILSSLNLMGGYTGVTGAGSSDWTAAGRTSRTSVVDLTGTTTRAFNATTAKQSIFDGFTFQNANNSLDGGVIAIGGSFDRGGTISDSLFQNNVTTGQGGAVFASANNDPVTIANVDFVNNTATRGGAIRVDGNNNAVTVQDSTFTGNRATNDGGAILSTGGNAAFLLLRSVLSGNSAFDEAGGLYIDDGNVTIRQGSFIDNTASGASAIGGDGFDGGTLAVENSLLADNTSTDGTGYVIDMRTNRTTDVTLHYVTIANNSGAGGVSSISSAQTGNLEILNSILVGDGTGIGILAEDNVNIDYNDVLAFAMLYSGAVAGTNSVSVDPEFVDASGGDYRLLSSSSLLSLATDLGINIDLLGELRPQDGGFTIGAFEASIVQNVPEPTSGTIWLLATGLGYGIFSRNRRSRLPCRS